jgi:hypothetical protein
VLAVALGLPIVAGSLGATGATTPGAPIELGGGVSVPTILGWEPSAVGETSATWEQGSHVLTVSTAAFDGTSAELLTAVEAELRAGAVTFAAGDAESLPVFGLRSLALHQPFVASLLSSAGEDGSLGTREPVEGLFAAAAADGLAVVVVAFSPEGHFRLVEDEVMAIIESLEAVEP